MQIDSTKIGYRWKGNYLATATYVDGDVTRKDGGMYAFNGSTWIKLAEDQLSGKVKGEILSVDSSEIVTGIVDQTLSVNGLGLPEFQFPSSNPKRVGVSKLPSVDFADSGGYNCYQSMYFIMSDGTLFVVGRTIYGLMGGTTRVDRNNNKPTQIHFPANAGRMVNVYPHHHCVHAIDHLGQLWGWGYNNYGQVGSGDTLVQYTPQLINGKGELPLNAKVTDVYSSNNSSAYFCKIFRTDDGLMYFVGLNQNATAGTQDTNSGGYNILTPLIMKKSLEIPMVKAYIGGGSSMMSVLQDASGKLYVCGESNAAGNYVYPIADWRTSIHNLIPQTAVTPAKSFECNGSAGVHATFVILLTNGEIIHWGNNTYGVHPHTYHPAGMIGDGRTNGNNWKEIKCWNGGYATIMGIKNDGSIWYTGYLTGAGTGGTAAAVGSSVNAWTRLAEFGYDNKHIKVTGVGYYRHWMVEKNNGSFMPGGYNYTGGSGNGTILNGYRGNEYDTLMRINVPIKEWMIGGYGESSSSYHTWYGLGTDGNVYSTGFNDYGQLGHDDVQQYGTTPSPILF